LQKKLYMCFIDYTKAFDCVDHGKLWSALKELGVPAHTVKLIRSLYEDQEATVRTRYGDTKWLKINKGTRQGCVISPLLFNLYAEVVMRRLDLDESNIGVKIGGRTISNIRYADDTTLLAESAADLKELILKLKTESEKMGLSLNVKKTKIMTTAAKEEVHITIDNEEIEVVDSIIFLGSLIVSNGDSTAEIKRRITLGRTAMVSMDQIWRCRDVAIATKRRLITAVVLPIATYGCETWTMKKADRRRIDAFELWCWRRLLRIPWTAKVTNKAVLERIGPEMSLNDKITKRKLTYFGHVMRADSLEKAMMLGMIGGKRRRGKPKTRWLDTIKDDTKMTIQELKHTVITNALWKNIIHRATTSRTRLNGL